MSTLPKATYIFDAITIEISMAFFSFEIGKSSKVNSRIFDFFSHLLLFFSSFEEKLSIKEYLGSHLEISIN